MANNRKSLGRFQVPSRGGSSSGPKFQKGGSGGQPAGIGALMGYIIAQKKSEQGRQRNPSEVTIGRTDPVTGERTITPEGVAFQAQQKNAEETAKESARVIPKLETIKYALKEMKNLASAVPTTRPGINRYIDKAANTYKGATGQIPQISEYKRQAKLLSGVIATAIGDESGNRLSDADRRIFENYFGDIEGDTDDQRALRYYGGYKFMNAKRKERNLQEIDLGEFFSPAELGRAKALSNEVDTENYSNEELQAALGELPGTEAYDVENYNPVMLEKLVSEYERRQLHRQGRES